MDSKLEDNSGRPVLDVTALRQAGLERIGQLSGSIWTDHNASDPGITLLEILCFAILDAGYRMTFDIRDLLTEAGETNPRFKNSFYEPYQALSSAPFTISDYRKLILENIDGIKNAWLKIRPKQIVVPNNVLRKKGSSNQGEENVLVKGFYDVFLDCVENNEDKNKATVSQVKNLLHKNRNLCEDFHPLLPEECVLTPFEVGIEAEIEVMPDYDYDEILSTILVRMTEYVSPDLHLYTLDEMLAKGKSVSEIFTGPFPKNGYVDIEEMDDFDSIDTLYVSDVINILMQIEGVLSVRYLRFVTEKINNDVTIDSYKISINNKETSKIVFRFAEKKLHKITFLLNDFKLKANSKTHKNDSQKQGYESELSYSFVKDTGINRELDRYYTIQNNLPKIYLTGKENISEDETDLRKAQRLQLKAYLTFFDQLTANLLIQLNNVKNMLSWEKSDNLDAWVQKQKSYLNRILTNEDIEDLDKIVATSGYATNFNTDIFNAEGELDKKNKILNHLLARFSEDFVSFSILQYISRGENRKPSLHSKFELIQNKSLLLEKLPSIGYRRATGIDYTSELTINETADENKWYDDGNYCTIERKLAIKFGVKSYAPLNKLHPEIKETLPGKIIFYDNRDADYSDAFGLHIYEHNLLVCNNIEQANFLYQFKNENETEYVSDPYSMKVTVALPGWLNIVQNHQFRDIVEQTIMDEFPAHIAVKICWIDPLQMYELEEAYIDFLEEKKGKSSNEKTKEFIEKLSTLRNVYHKMILSETDNKKSTLLGYSTLGFKGYEWCETK